MWKNVIGDHIRRTNRNLLVTNLIILFLLAGCAGLSARYFANFVHGPEPIRNDTLAATQDPDKLKQYWVKIKGDKSAVFGQMVEKKRSGAETVRDTYMLLKIGQKALIVKRGGNVDDKETEFTGSLNPIPSEVHTKLLDDILAKNPKLESVLLPYMLDTGSFRVPGYIGLACGVPIGLLSLWNISKARKRMADLNLHPTAMALIPYGRPEDVAYSVDSEVKMSGQKIGPVTLTQNWLLRSTSYSQDVIKLDALVWIYEKVTQHRTNGVPTGKTYAAVLCDRNGKMLEIQSSKDNTEQILQMVSARVPWVILGFDAQLAQAYKKDLAGLVASVDQRRQAPPVPTTGFSSPIEQPFSSGPKGGFPGV